MTSTHEILICTHCGWFITADEIEMIDDAIAEHCSGRSLSIQGILCPKCMTHPTFKPVSEASIAQIYAIVARLNSSARGLYRELGIARHNKDEKRVESLARRYNRFQTSIQEILESARHGEINTHGEFNNELHHRRYRRTVN